jgi:hypothetical protein
MEKELRARKIVEEAERQKIADNSEKADEAENTENTEVKNAKGPTKKITKKNQ